MIIVNCPHCGKEHILYPDELENLIRGRKVVITDCSCGKLYTIEQGSDRLFAK